MVINNQRNSEVVSVYDFASISQTRGKSSSQLARYEELLCELDNSRIQALKSLRGIRDVNVMDKFHEFIQNPMISICKELKKFGGGYQTKCKYTDGSKFICMDDLMSDIKNGECLIYSFGIDEDWSFEDVMSKVGCKIYAHDPTVDYPRKRSENIFFEKVGVASKTDLKNNLKDLKSILSGNGHTNTKISYLKMDIEEYELEGLPAWLKSGALDNVDQIGLEFHLNTGNVVERRQKTRSFSETLIDLYSEANFCLISYEANNCYKNIDKNQKYYSLAEIVLKKRKQSHQCSKM